MLDNLERFKDVIEISDVAKILHCGRNAAKRAIPIEMSFFNVNGKTYVNKSKFYKYLSSVLCMEEDTLRFGIVPDLISISDVVKEYGLTLEDMDEYKRNGRIRYYDFFGLIRYNKSDIDKIVERNNLRAG